MESIKLLASVLGLDIEATKAFLGEPRKTKERQETTVESGTGVGKANDKLPAGFFGDGKPPKLGDQPVNYLLGRYTVPAGLPAKSYTDAGQMTAAAMQMAQRLNALAPLIIQQGGKSILPSSAKLQQEGLGSDIQNVKKAYEGYGASLTKLEAELGVGIFGPGVKKGFTLTDLFDAFKGGQLSAKQLVDARRIILSNLDNVMQEKFQASVNKTQRELDALKKNQQTSQGKFQ
jgi:hypothetical protein